jgi:hypothetical protein
VELDDRELQRLKKLVPYKVLAPTPDEICNEIERLNKLKERYQLEKEVFKDRIEKAIEYMNYTFNISSVKEMYEIMNELEEILQGSDKE